VGICAVIREDLWEMKNKKLPQIDSRISLELKSKKKWPVRTQTTVEINFNY
jgi:hypothetical protein